MGVISLILLVVFVISSVLLVVVVLIQDDQGEGLGGLFGGGGATAFGSRSGNILTKFTSILAALFLVCAFGIAWINRTPEGGDVLGAARRAQVEEVDTEWWNATSNDSSDTAGENSESAE